MVSWKVVVASKISCVPERVIALPADGEHPAEMSSLEKTFVIGHWTSDETKIGMIGDDELKFVSEYGDSGTD